MPTFLECSFFTEKALNNCFLAVNAKKHFWPSNICVPYKHKIYQEAKGVKTNLGEIFFPIIHALTAINRFCFFFLPTINLSNTLSNLLLSFLSCSVILHV